MYMSNPLEAFNAALAVLEDVRTFMVANADDCATARANGADIIDLREKPNAQPSYALTEEAAQRIRDAGERLPRRVSENSFPAEDLRMSKVPAYATEVDPEAIHAAFRSLRALTVQARLAVRLDRAGDERNVKVWGHALESVNKFARKVRSLDPALFDCFFEPADKQYVTDRAQAALLGVGGFHWTASLKGDATETRYNEGREVKSNCKRDMSHADYRPASIDEDALADAAARELEEDE